MSGKELRKMNLLPRCGLTGTNGIVSEVVHPGVINAVEEGEIQHIIKTPPGNSFFLAI